MESDEMYCAHPGDIVGIFETLTSDIPFVTRVAKTRVRVASVPASIVYSLLVDNPDAVLHLAAGLIDKLSPFVRQIDFAMDWLQVCGLPVPNREKGIFRGQVVRSKTVTFSESALQ